MRSFLATQRIIMPGNGRVLITLAAHELTLSGRRTALQEDTISPKKRFSMNTGHEKPASSFAW